MSSATKGMKRCVSLVNNVGAAENAVMALDEHLKTIYERHSLSQIELALFRLVGNIFTSFSNFVKTNTKILSPGGGDPEWTSKRKDKDRRLQDLTYGPIYPSCLTYSLESSIKIYNQEKENGGGRPAITSTVSILLQFQPPMVSDLNA